MKKVLAFIAAALLGLSAGLQSYAQNGYKIQAIVVDDLGPIAGAGVLEKGTSNGTATDLDGAFALTVSSADAQIEISFVGYATLTFKASEVPAEIKLAEDNLYLEDAVVIGYGSQKKKEVTGSVASVKAEDFNSGVKSNPMGLLQGKVAGLNIIRTTSDPTETGYNIQIRGFSTLDKGAGTSPLFIVDGVPVSNIDNISPNEIASMDVLKDGSAAAIYGTRGTNGVIIITTKRGENFTDVAQTRVEYAGYASASVRNGNLGMATPEEFVKLGELSNGIVTPGILRDADGNYQLTDWVGELTRDVAFTHSHDVAISGSSSKFNYRASISHKNAQGIAKVTNRKETIAKISASQKALSDKLELQYDLSYMQYRNDKFCGSFKDAALMNPTYPVYDKSTASGYYRPIRATNPVENMNNRESYSEGNFFRGSVKATLTLLKGLRLSAFGALEDGDNYGYWANKTINTDVSGSGKAGRNTDLNRNRLFETTLDYNTSFNGHSIAAVAGFSYQNFMYDGSSMENKGFSTEGVKYYQIGNGDAEGTFRRLSSYRNSNTLAAFFGRVNYNYMEKYMLSASLRREGSSRFGANHKWGYFPAVSAGWRISGEDFMEDVTAVNDLKLRLGFGVTGNNLNSDLMSVAMLSNGGTFWYNGKYVNTYTVFQNVNPDLRWEKKYEYNLGLDYALLDNRLYGSLDVYYRQTRDLLWDYEVPTPPYQYPTLLANAGQMDSFGVELSLSAVPVKTKDFTWVTTPTISFNRNYITKLSDPALGFNYKQTTVGGVGEDGMMSTNTQILIEGESVGSFYGYKFLTIEDGTWYFGTPAGGVVTSEGAVEGYRQVIGNAQPLFTFGWNNSIRYKNFDLALFFRGVYGNDVLNLTRWAYGPMATVQSNIFMKDINGANTVLANKGVFSDYYLEDGSYIKLDNLTLGYTFKVKDNSYVDHLRLYFTGQNLFTLTKYSGQDPEVNTTDVRSAGIDYCDFYPTVATFMLGVNISFK